MKNTPAEVRKRIEEMLEEQARQFDDINKKIAAERKAEADARAAIEQAVADLDFDRNHKAKRDLEEAIERRELLSKRAELYRSRKLVTEEESDKVIDSLLRYEGDLAAEYVAGLDKILDQLEEMTSKYAADVEEAENVILTWTQKIFPNYRSDSALYKGGTTNRAPNPVPVHTTAYQGCTEFLITKEFVKKLRSGK